MPNASSAAASNLLLSQRLGGFQNWQCDIGCDSVLVGFNYARVTSTAAAFIVDPVTGEPPITGGGVLP